jgi:hypothetical protein
VKAKSSLLAATEDYSEYESVDEEMDTEPEKTVKGGRRKKQESSDASVKDQTDEKKKTKLTAGGAKLKKVTIGSGKGSISGFFMSAPK